MPTKTPTGLTVLTLRGPLTLSIGSRVHLLRELEDRPDTAAVIAQLHAAGPLGTITLDADGTKVMLAALHAWATRVAPKKPPPDVDELRSALARDLRRLDPTAEVWPPPEPTGWIPWEPSAARVFAPRRILIEVPEDDVLLLLSSLDAGGRLEQDAAAYIRAGDEERPLQPDIRTTRALLKGLKRLDDRGDLTGPLRRLEFELEFEE